MGLLAGPDLARRAAWNVTDEDAAYLTQLRHGALHHRTIDAAPEGVTVFTLDRLSLTGLVTGTLDAGTAIAEGKITIDGDATVMLTLVGLMAEPDPAFNIVTPWGGRTSRGARRARSNWSVAVVSLRSK